jgi:predicted RNase H-like HicB family nuclease
MHVIEAMLSLSSSAIRHAAPSDYETIRQFRSAAYVCTSRSPKLGRVTIAGKPSAELPPGTERSILKQAGLDREDPMTSYAFVVERAGDGGYGAWCPDLPSRVALADTEDAVIAERRQAIELHLAGLREDGQPAPQPATVAATVITLGAA